MKFLAPLVLSFATYFATTKAQCHPNFSGRAVSIYTHSGNLEWGQGTLVSEQHLQYQAPSPDVGEFKIEFTPIPDSTYFIKSADAPANNFYAAQGPRSTLVSWLQINNGLGPRWEISCEYCSPNNAWSMHGIYASGCKVTLYDLCVREDANSTIGSYPNLYYTCDGSPGELFHFILP